MKLLVKSLILSIQLQTGIDENKNNGQIYKYDLLLYVFVQIWGYLS